ncbi:MAG: GNAT family N-acetyltransferase [Synechococcus sp. SB0668_bin_15]|nr:GNAT family N-acetyltransferase [Synechococcus sp. SB0668_bin_15]MXZ82605.1 GNAT family N-acetyltransferase [Synechococcus sp. SB0666_bin_14]MYA90539.1 GNAT family N-acetyltransferase [Synechococcus sp. SB0663_bin_10]MYC50536.1 GNAT family N-acetyltransferase [Synechococcus sp. SB0662_bin_14]MYG46007.1 GNAT family N-acetyltransferase [Synechococcus sp. SB0675_bin_6]MYJ59239.1 GNAT family N-acetyltransferase [Synechococcus sp. SB0672_bin_6]
MTKDADLFPSDMLEDMIAGYIGQTNRDIWFVSVADRQVVGFGFCQPERMMSGTWNLLAIGILTSYRGRGIGRSMTGYLENRLRLDRQRILIVETMGTPEFRQTRAFYNATGLYQGGSYSRVLRGRCRQDRLLEASVIPTAMQRQALQRTLHPPKLAWLGGRDLPW